MESEFNPEDSKRIRTMTEKAAELFNEEREDYKTKSEAQWAVVENLISSFSSNITNLDYLNTFESDLSKAYAEYCSTSAKFVSLLTRARTEESIKENQEHSSFMQKCKESVMSVIDKINESRQAALEYASRRSRISRSTQSKNTHSSNSSSQLARMRAKAEAAKVRLDFVQQETSILKQKAVIAEQEEVARAASLRKQKELEAELRLLNTKQEVAATKAEAEALENEDGKPMLRDLERLEALRPIDPMERTQRYIHEQSVINREAETKPAAELNAYAPAFLPRQPRFPEFTLQDRAFLHRQPNIPDTSANGHDQINYFTQFLLKKDLLISRLTRFDDQPQTYIFWKAQFQEIIKELETTKTEELDLLTKWLGPAPLKYATSIRSANVSDPSEALKRIWERLDERYGSPELLESVLMSKLSSFPKLTNRDNVKLYNLLDLLCEIESLMSSPKYRSLLSHFNSSSGIAPILCKLPHNIQEKWITHAYKYKQQHAVVFPPFTCFVSFMKDISKMRNDPGFMYTTENATNSYTVKEKVGQRNNQVKQWIDTKKTGVTQNSENLKSTSTVCPLHKANHSLNDCRGFRDKSFEERKRFLRDNKICFKCCNSDEHKYKECTAQIRCSQCGGHSHPSALHIGTRTVLHGGEKTGDNSTTSACTQVCRDGFSGKSCAKVVLVNLHQTHDPSKTLKAYAIIDDQSNRILVKSEVFDQLYIESEMTDYQLTSCSGVTDMLGRQALNLTVSSLDGSSSVDIPIVIECNHIPDIRNEKPTPEVAKSYTHLQNIADDIPEVNENVPILILIGRDIPEAHHVAEPRTGPRNSPFAQRLTLGWVIVGESCLNKVHRPNSVVVNKTYLLPNGRTSMFQPCPNNIHVEVHNKDTGHYSRDLDSSIFMK